MSDNSDDVPVMGTPEGMRRGAAIIFRKPLFEVLQKVIRDREIEEEERVIIGEAFLGVINELDKEVAKLFQASKAIRSSLESATQMPLFDLRATGECVYFQTDGEFVKIGRTTRSESKRRRENQTGNPRPLTTLAVIHGASEKKLHERFKGDHIRGEWHRMSDDIMAFVKAWQTVETAF